MLSLTFLFHFFQRYTDGAEGESTELRSAPMPVGKRRKFNTPFRSPLLCVSQDHETPHRNTVLKRRLSQQTSSTVSRQSSTSQGRKPQSATPCNDHVSTPSKVGIIGRHKSLPIKFQSPLLATLNMNSATPSDTAYQKAKEELRRLKLLEYHKKHNDLNTLATITRKWADAGHKAIHELTDLINQDPKPSIPDLLSVMRIPQEHISCTCDGNRDDDF